MTPRPLATARDALIALQGQLIALLAAQNAALAAWVACAGPSSRDVSAAPGF